jgi:hypothetical protein
MELLLGKYKEAIKIQEAVLELYNKTSYNYIFSGSSKDNNCLDFYNPLFYLRASLTLDYCRAQRFEAAAELAKLLLYRLHAIKHKELFEVFNTLVGVAIGLDYFGQYEVLEPILVALVETCLEVHRKRKSYITYIALKQLSFHYRLRYM